MAEQPCLPQVHACRIRIADLAADGTPLPGEDSLYVSEALVRMGVTPVYKDGNEIEVENACGTVCVNHKGDDSLKRADFTLQICTTDPYLKAKLSGGSVITDGDRVGFAAPSIGPITGNGISIELWTKRVDTDGDLDADSPYAWWAYPKAKNLRMAEWEHAAAAILPSFSGQLYENPNWGDGPTNDWPAASTQYHQWIPTDTLPTATCGALELVAS